MLNQIGTVQITGKADNGVIYINAQDKITANAANIDNNAQNGETILTAKDIELGTVTLSHKEKFGEISDKNHRIVETMQEVGTNVHGNGDIKIIANSGSLKGTAVNVDSTNGTATLYGEKSVEIKDGRQTLFLDEGYETKSRGILSSKTTTAHIQRNDDEAIASNITGNNVAIQSKGDIRLTGTNAVSDNGTVVYSENGDIKIQPAKNYYATEEEIQTKKSGLTASFKNGVFSAGYEKRKEYTDDNNTQQTALISQVGSLQGDTQIIAKGGTVATQAAYIDGKNVDIYGKDGVEISSLELTNTQDYYNQVDKSGFSLNVNVKSLGDNLKKATKQAVKMASPSYMAYENVKNKKDAYEQNKGDGAKG
ncbi:MAG: hypothetical protein IJV56_05715, partial [Neisseriaceae bacterium]|nr:hypothetical protein [Neisseriaceae bacterium]